MLQEVYHELSDERNIKAIRESGLYSRLENLKKRKLQERISFEEWVDSVAREFLPSSLRDRGFSRLASIFAWPNLPQNKKRVVELVIEDENALVLPHDCYTSATDFGMRDNSFIRRYWSEALLLKDFLNKYNFKPFAGLNYYVWQDEDGFQYTQPEVIFRPEAIRDFKRILPF